jgi:multidrug efflux pump subunit AcrA (membrane-fusion protein)
MIGSPAVVAIGFFWVLNGCGKEQVGKAIGTEESNTPMSVEVIVAAPDSATSAEEAPGTVRPVETAVLSAKIAGTILEIHADPGRVVRKGDLLARIDDREIRARMENAMAALDQARNDFTRLEKLHRDKVITAQEFDAA